MENLVPYIVHESTQARLERIIKRLTIALIVAVIFVFASNAAWLVAWCQYDYASETTETVTVDGKDGIANYANNGGSVVNGFGEKDNDQASDTNQEGLQGDEEEEVMK